MPSKVFSTEKMLVTFKYSQRRHLHIVLSTADCLTGTSIFVL